MSEVVPFPKQPDEPTLWWWWDEPPVTCEQCEFTVDWLEMNEGGRSVECECGGTVWES